MSKKPFIIKTHLVEPTVPRDHEVFDQEQESKIQILQAINGYLTVRILTLRSIWLCRAVRYFGPSGITPNNVPPSLTSRLGSWHLMSSGACLLTLDSGV